MKIQNRIIQVKQAGFTLVELLIYMALFSVFVLIISEIFLSLLETKVESIGTASIEQDGRYLVAKLTQDINQSTSITTPSSLGSSGSTLVLNRSGDTYTYSLSNGQITVVGPAGTDRLTGSGTIVTALNFTKLGATVDAETVRFQVDLKSVAERRGGPETRVFVGTAGRR